MQAILKILSISEIYILIFIVSEEECYHCMATLVAAKEKMFITQTKLLYEVTWKTVMQITKKHVVSFYFPFLYAILQLWS